MIIISILLITLSCIIIWRASDGFEAASIYLGRNLSEGVRGATINAIGSSMPELFTTLFFLFVLKDKDGFAAGIGTTAGSALFNAMIIPALVVFIVIKFGFAKGITVSKKVILRDGLALIFCEFILILLLNDTKLTWIHGIVLVALYVAYAVYMVVSMKVNQNKTPQLKQVNNHKSIEIKKNNMFKSLFVLDLESVFVRKPINKVSAWSMLIVAMSIIGASCLMLVKSCEWLGEELNIPIYFIAVVLASAATSVPDTILSIKDAKHGKYDDAISNALGSNIFDVCFALGFPLLVFTLFYGPINMNAETVQNVAELRILLLLLTIGAFFVFIGQKLLNYLSAFWWFVIYFLFIVFILGRSVDAAYAQYVAEFLDYLNLIFSKLIFWN